MPESPRTMQVGATADHVRINAAVAYGHGPLDVDPILFELDHVHAKAQLYLARTKFAYDVSMLRAALYALATDKTMTEAINDIENLSDAETLAINLLHGYLASQGWRPYDAIDGTKPVYEDRNGAFGGKLQVELGAKHSGDIIVSLATGTTLIAEADSAYLFHWEEIPTRLVYEPRTYDRWWFVRNFKDDLGPHPDKDARRIARQNLTIPAVPADLTALIATTKKEN